MSVKILNESMTPEVGPFYVIDGAIFSDTESAKDLGISSLGAYVDSNNGHYQFWKFLQRIYPEFKRVDYDYYPRGRVVYDRETDTYHLFIDPCLSDRTIINKIIREFNLPASKLNIDSEDEHYHCKDCNPDYVNVYENYR